MPQQSDFQTQQSVKVTHHYSHHLSACLHVAWLCTAIYTSSKSLVNYNAFVKLQIFRPEGTILTKLYDHLCNTDDTFAQKLLHQTQIFV